MYRTSGSQRVCHDLQLFCPRANTNSFLFSLVCSSVKVWNSLPYDVVHALSVHIFKCRLNRHVISVSVFVFVLFIIVHIMVFCFILQGFPSY